MKKILLMVAVIAMAATANAQWYVGGSIGFGSVKVGDGSAESTYKIVPEVGYNLNDNWAIGLSMGYQKGACEFGTGNFLQNVDTEVFSFNPYVRYTFLTFGMIDVFADGGFGIASVKDIGTEFQFGIRPGIALNASDKVSLVAGIGFFGFDTFSPDEGDSSNAFGLNLDNAATTFGLYYNF
ncbi:MAG: porin family protein [Bacteroidales bacterium]|nr:porin family protein [Bacteroidales bacterium]